ncbi:MAG: LPS assembly lipoprotein LptE [Oxalicibacterium faecigallinarum]|uniref:LPS-assembly lipoprotein LptE n=1 Tax=Oxalicibacterium faecigallinarum TaxID=573741 RepID=UPI0028087D1D|nr:LPS assembly lipoprotein LptE [Oxalicibacterium faecigallinarum]MDQ7968051.1 LPS assembly lipoprotein LptE [Oxalicibacterium faecigallinarum]
MLKKRRLLCLALGSTSLLTACGFKLRGSLLGNDLPFKTLYIEIPPTSTLGVELRRNIRGSGEVQLKEIREEAEAILAVTSETREKVILSLNSQGRVREFAIHYRVTIRVLDNKNAELLPPTQISLRRDVTYNEDQVLAKEAEEVMLYKDMQSDAVQQILRRVASIQRPTSAATPQ